MTPLVILCLCGGDPATGLRERLMAHVNVLAADSMEGRGLGTVGLCLAEGYLRDAVRSLGLAAKPAWCPPDTVRAGEKPVVNVIASSGSDTAMIALCAHYDHLGMRVDSSGAVPYNGAHDNASGVAVVLEAARVLVEGGMDAGLLICLFSGEEEGLIGSGGFVEKLPSGCIRTALCIDAVGHLDSTLMIIGGTGHTTLDSLAEWAAKASGMPVSRAPSLPSGDHASFLRREIPALGLSTGPHLLMNTPGDDPSTLDYDGMVDVTRMVTCLAKALASADVPLEPAAPPPADAPRERRARLGTMPDLTYTGHGMRVAGVVPGSPAEEAGLQTGDVITAISDRSIAGPADLARALAGLEPGVAVRVGFSRGDVPCTADVVLARRE